MPPVRKPLLLPTLGGGKLVERVQITEIELPPGEPTGLHVHPVPVVGYVVAGRIRFEVEGETVRTLAAGDAFHEPPDVKILHFDNASGEDSARFVAVYLQGADDQEVIRMLGAR